jgi:two-component system phosphate regulon response regulator PhoB
MGVSRAVGTLVAADRTATHRPHVLIVTSDESLRDFLAEGLVYGGFWTSVIASGLQVLEVFRLRTFDLMLIDAALGGLGALEVVRRLRGRSAREGQASPRTDIPIVVIAADPSEIDAGEAMASGVDEIVLAPLDLETLVPHLHQIIARWRAEHPGRPWADELAQRPNAGAASK